MINLNGLDEEVKKKIINLQNLQQSLEFITQQKVQIESNLRETELAIEELEKLNPDDLVYKSIGGIMVKSEKNKLLDEKKSLKITLEMRSKTLKQKEDRVKNQLETMKKSIQSDLQAK
ncbi:MAG: prefoldin subunit beta [Promethearchaeota archaeon]